MKKIIAFIPFLILISSCSGQALSRTKAKEVILKFKNMPFNVTQSVHTTYLVSNKGHGMHVCMLPDAVDFLPAKGLLTDFANKGLVTLTDRSTHDDCDIEYKDVSFTDLGKKYVVGQNQDKNAYFIKLCQMDFGEITDIVMIPNYNAAQVEYTFKSANVTPFGETYRAIDINYVPPTVKKTITLVKYDDGWRVKQ